MEKNMSIIRIALDEKDKTYFVDEVLQFEERVYAPPAPAIGVSPLQNSSQVSFVKLPAGIDSGWHPSPARQYFTVLSGEALVKVSTGEERLIKAGSTLLLEDIRGQGHNSHIISKEPLLAIVTVL
jgi:quercetin dioxygenase-like cupin family protein